MPNLGMTCRSFSPGADRFFEAIRPYRGDGTVWFPRALRGLDTSRSEGDPLHSWFRRVVDGLGSQAPGSFALEENMGLLATIKWTSDSVLTYANIQVIVTDGSLESYYCESDRAAFYLRFDSDETTLGEPFSHPHPHPHIHLDGSLSPRFALDGGTSANVVVDFVEFLYRHYQPDDWLSWATKIWNRDFARRSLEPDQNSFPEILTAFRNGQLNTLRNYRSELGRLKQLLWADKERISPLRTDPFDRELLEYPLAR